MSSRKTYRLTGPRHRAVVVDRVPEDLARTWLENPRAFFDDGPAWSGTTPQRVTRAQTPIGSLFVKEGRRKLLRTWLDALVGRAPASTRAFETGLVLEEAKVGATRPVAVFERRQAGESFLLLEFVDAPDLHRYLVRELEGLDDDARRERQSALWPVLARAIADLHRARVRQRDLKAPNILVESDKDRDPRIVFVDLEGMERLEELPTPGQRERDLGRLATSLHAPALQELGIDDDDWHQIVDLYLTAAGTTGHSDGWVTRTLEWAARKEERQRRLGKEIW